MRTVKISFHLKSLFLVQGIYVCEKTPETSNAIAIFVETNNFVFVPLCVSDPLSMV